MPDEDVRSMSIYDAMDFILESVNVEFAANGISLPSRQYLAFGTEGETVHDCEQVTVSFAQMYNGTPGMQEQTPTRCDSPRTGVFIVEVVRCIPLFASRTSGGKGTSKYGAPSAQELTEKTKMQTQDAYVLMDAGLKAAESLSHFNGISDVSPGPISGGYQATVLTIITGIP